MTVTLRFPESANPHRLVAWIARVMELCPWVATVTFDDHEDAPAVKH